MEDSPTLVNLLAYVDLNPIRAGIVKRPEEYKWCSLGYFTRLNRPSVYGFAVFNWASVQTGNKDPDEILLRRSLREFHGASDLLSVDFVGMKEWNEHSPKEIVRKYREFVYETGYSEDGGQRTAKTDKKDGWTETDKRDGWMIRTDGRTRMKRDGWTIRTDGRTFKKWTEGGRQRTEGGGQKIGIRSRARKVAKGVVFVHLLH